MAENGELDPLVSKIDYIMDDPREAERLSDKVDAKSWVQRHLATHMRNGQAVLDVGCGPGVIADEVARSYPESHVTGVDLIPERFRAITKGKSQPTNFVLQQGDAQALAF